MTCPPMPRGAAPVGHLSELGIIETVSVLYMRQWCKGGPARNDVWRDFRRGFGETRGEQLSASFDQLCEFCLLSGRRPLARHSIGCPFIGADEACFANLIATAAEAEHEDTLLMACLLVRADVAPLVSGLAMDFGLALKRLRLAVPSPDATETNGAPASMVH